MIDKKSSIKQGPVSSKREIGTSLITFGTLVNSCFLVESSQLSLDTILDLFALTEALVFNNKVYFIPISPQEAQLYHQFDFYKRLLNSGILIESSFIEEDENSLESLIKSEFLNYKNGKTLIEKALYQIGKIMPKIKEYKEHTLSKIFTSSDLTKTEFSSFIRKHLKSLEEIYHKKLDLLISTKDKVGLYMMYRIFLYYSLASEKKIGFCPDYLRAPVLLALFETQYNSLPIEFYNIISKKWETKVRSRIEYDNLSTLPIPLLGTILLKKCKDSRKSIVEVIFELRKECENLRKKCFDLEDNLLNKNVRDSFKAQKAIEKISNDINLKYDVEMDERFLYKSIRFVQEILKYLLNPKELLSLDPEKPSEIWRNRITNQFISLSRKAEKIDKTNQHIKKIFGKELPDEDIIRLKMTSRMYSPSSSIFKNLISYP
ncbi:MAG: hypothetical protein PVH61_41960 [Candidatus Aminicenantes bacterium]|jgi:hypothetical protein